MRAVHCWILLWACLWSRGDAFNLEVHSYAQHYGAKGSMFGFSIAEHMTSRENLVLVGAPNFDTRQPDVSHGGAVFRCDPLSNKGCNEVVFDPKGSNYDEYRKDNKSDQWFGATLTSTGLQNGPVVACAPRYVFLGKFGDKREPVGTCYVARNDLTEFVEYSPCRTSRFGYNRQGSCEAGFSAAITQDGKRLFVGAPGSWYWQGQMYSINTTLRAEYITPEYIEYGSRTVGPEGQIYSSGMKDDSLVYSTPQSEFYDDDSYLGYSSVVGDFHGDGDQGVAVGMPRGSVLYGKVVMYTWKLQGNNTVNRTGEQLGAYFGYSLAACDVDGDGLEDLIVGAPMYTIPNNEGHYENGRVYVMYQGRAMNKYENIQKLDGENSKSRFGLALTSLGDINLDGFQDFAVGAPYDVGGGAVYIYHGGERGAGVKPVQVIRASELSLASPPIQTFGFSLSGGVDLDNNRYTDLAVGAYASDTAMIFRSRPVIKVTASIKLGESNSKLISLDEKNCTLPAGNKGVACTSFEYCIQYNGINVDIPIEFNLQFVLDSKKPRDPRLFFLNEEERNILNRRIALNRNQTECRTERIYIVDEVRDKLTSLEVEMHYSLVQERRTFDYNDPREPLTPVLDLHSGYSRKDAINIQKNCGSNNVCIPKLQLQVTPSVGEYLLGSEERLWLDVSIYNAGEDAFEASYSLQLPSGVQYVKVEQADTKRVPVQCSPPTQDNNNTLLCNIGNPLPMKQNVFFRVILEADHQPGMASEYQFSSRVNSTNPEPESDDKIKVKAIRILVETNLALTGTSVPPDLHYNTTQYQSTNITSKSLESDIGPQLVHVYSARNNGPSAIEQAEIYLVIPYETAAGDPLLYLLEQPETAGKIHCEEADFINKLGVHIDHKTKSYLKSSGVTTQGTRELSEEEKRRIESGIESSHHFSWEERHTGSNSQTGGTQHGESISHSSKHFQTGGTYHEESSIQNSGHFRTGSQSQTGGVHQTGSFTDTSGKSQAGIQSQAGGTYYEKSSRHNSENSRTGSQSQTGGTHQDESLIRTNGNMEAGSQSQAGAIQNGGRNTQYGGHITKETVSQWNSSSVDGVVHHNVYNKTIEHNERGEVHRTESSTEFYTVGREGQPGSSFRNNNYGQQGQNTGGGRTTYTSGGTYAHGAGRQQGFGAQNTFSTEESVNKDLVNAYSTTYKNNYNNGGNSQVYNSNREGHRGSNQGSGSELSVGERQTPTGVGTVAHGVNGEFRTNTLELGVLGGSAGEESRQHTGINHGSSVSSHSGHDAASYSSSGTYGSGLSSSSGSYRSGGSAGTVQSGSSSGYQSGSSNEYSRSGGQASSHDSHYSYHSNYGSYPSDNTVTERPVVADRHFQWDTQTRRRRQVSEEEQLDKEIHCEGLKCAVVRCVTGQLFKGQEVWIALRARVNANTLNKLAAEKAVQVSSRVVSRVPPPPHIRAPAEAEVQVAEAVTHVTPQQPGGTGGGVPLWVVVLSACAGAALLLLLVFALYKCGFFKRNRPTDGPERQPLNRNGYGHGDEQL